MEWKEVGPPLGWAEGPVFSARGDIVATSMDQGAVFRIGPGDHLTRYAVGGMVNGAAEDEAGCVFLAQAGGVFPGTRVEGITGGIQVIDAEGVVRWVTQDPVAPNDLCFGPDGMLYVTDPTRARPERDDGRLWCVDPATGVARILVSVPWYPNGIGIGPDDRLYVSSTGDGRIVRFDLEEGRLQGGDTFVEVSAGGPDGFAFDVEGNLVVCCIGGEGEAGHLEVWSADARLLQRISPGASRFYTNVALAADGRMIVTESHDSGGVIMSDVRSAAGLPLYPFRGRI
jgi:gluconolactonase